MTLDLASTAFLAQMAGMGAPPFTEMSAQDARAAVADLAELYGEGPDMASSHDVSVPTADGDTIGARVLTPHGGGRAVLVYFHGGGWVFGDIDGYETVGRLLAEKTRSVVVLVDYRKAPEHPYPTAPNDAWDALTWVDANMASLVGKRLPIVVAGDSAGGNLAAVVAQKAKAAGGPDIALQVLVYPVTDAAMDTESCADPACQLLLSTELMAWFCPIRTTGPSLMLHPYGRKTSPVSRRRLWSPQSSIRFVTRAKHMPTGSRRLVCRPR